MQTIFEVSIQPATGYLVNCHLSIHTQTIRAEEHASL